MRKIFTICMFLFVIACGGIGSSKVVMPDKTYSNISWTNDEKQKDIAVRSLYSSTDSSTHLMRIKGQEFPHYHDKHDLYGTVLSGRVRLNFEDNSRSLGAGDTFYINKGTYHWAQNDNDDASEIFVVFSPAFDGKDRRPAQ